MAFRVICTVQCAFCFPRIYLYSSALACAGLARLGSCDKQGRDCNCFNEDIHISENYPSGVTTFAVFHLTNTCPCDAISIVVKCEGWTQRMVDPHAMLVNVPSFGLCTLYPGVRIKNGLDYWRTYHSLDLLPLSLHSVKFDPRCKHTVTQGAGQ